jgi:VWFA-related protein
VTRTVPAAGLLLLFGWVLAGLPPAPVVPVHAQAQERVLYVSVVDGKGMPVTELGPTDIVVREDGVAREVLRVTPATAPMPIAVLIDNSQVAERAIPDIRPAVATFVRLTQPLGPISLVTFADRPTVLVDYTSDPKALTAGANRIFAQPGSGPTMLDAIAEASQGLLRRESERAAIVVLGTAQQELGNYGYQQVLERLRDAGASLNVVMFSPPGQLQFDLRSRDRQTVIDTGTRDTGGYRMDVLATQAFEEQMTRVANALRHQFRVVYARPESLIPPEKVQVTAARAGFAAHGAPARGQKAR